MIFVLSQCLSHSPRDLATIYIHSNCQNHCSKEKLPLSVHLLGGGVETLFGGIPFEQHLKFAGGLPLPGMIHAHPKVRQQRLYTTEGMQDAKGVVWVPFQRAKNLEKQGLLACKQVSEQRTCNIDGAQPTKETKQGPTRENALLTRHGEHVTCVKRHVRVAIV